MSKRLPFSNPGSLQLRRCLFNSLLRFLDYFQLWPDIILNTVAKMDSSNYLQGRNRYSRTSKRSRRGLSDDIFKQYYKVAEACGKGKPFVEHVLQVTGFACQSVISIWCDCFLSSSFGLLGRIATPIQPWQVVVLTTHTGGSQDSRVATKCTFVELSTDLVQELILLGINTHLMSHDSRSHESLMIMTL